MRQGTCGSFLKFKLLRLLGIFGVQRLFVSHSLIMSERDSNSENGASQAPSSETNSEVVSVEGSAESVPQAKAERPVYDGPALPLRRVEVQEGGSFVPEPTREDEDGNKVHTSISEKWKVYDSEPVPWTQEERQVSSFASALCVCVCLSQWVIRFARYLGVATMHGFPDAIGEYVTAVGIHGFDAYSPAVHGRRRL